MPGQALGLDRVTRLVDACEPVSLGLGSVAISRLSRGGSGQAVTRSGPQGFVLGPNMFLKEHNGDLSPEKALNHVCPQDIWQGLETLSGDHNWGMCGGQR